ncbi:MAG: hypothetical protein AAF402_07605 [Pseudomonadota bacterium]
MIGMTDKANRGRRIIWIACFLTLMPLVAFAGVSDQPYKPINLAEFVANNRPHKEGTKSVVPPTNIRFIGKVMQIPQAREFKYVYRALAIMEVMPPPEITHQMFIADENENVISVYVEKSTAEIFIQHLKAGDAKEFTGYHLYNYKRGPAIVVDGIYDGS